MRANPGRVEPALLSQLESLLLVAGGPVEVGALANAVQHPPAAVRRALTALAGGADGGIRVQLHGDAAQLVTAPENREVVQRFLGVEKPPPLSRPALETLAVVAYHQPVTRAEIEQTRGVNSDRAVQILVARGLVEEVGHRATLGRPAEYGTTFAFLEYFGLASLDDLPPMPQPDELDVEPQVLGLRSQTGKSPGV